MPNSQFQLSLHPTSIRYNSVKLIMPAEGQTQTIDITESFYKITITESIYSKFLKGSIQIKDEESIFSSIEIISFESKVSISLTSLVNNANYNFEFVVTNKSFIKEDGSPKQIIMLSFCEASSLAFLKEYSTSFNQQLISNFVSNFSQQVLNKPVGVIEQSQNTFTIAFPYQKFHYMLIYLNQFLTSVNGYFNYIYFTRINGLAQQSAPLETVYASYGYLINQQPAYILQEATKGEVQSSQNYFIKYDYKNNNNFIQNATSKGFGSTKINFNPQNKQIVTDPYTYEDSTQTQNFLGRFTIFPSALSSPDYFHYYSSSLTSQKHKVFTYFNSFVNGDNLIIDMPKGFIERNCGQVVSVTFFNYFRKSSMEYEPSKTSNWFCDEVIHNFGPASYTQQLSLIRNGKMVQTSTNQLSLSHNNININA